MDFNKMANQAKQMIAKRGGIDSVKVDARELEDVLKSDESFTEKDRDAAAAIKEPGTPGGRSANA